MTLEQRIAQLEQQLALMQNKRIFQHDLTNLCVKARHIDGLIIFRGAATDLPADGSTEKQAFFDETNNKLYVWNTSTEAWVSVTLS